ASLWDLGDGIACFEITTKMNAIDPDVFALLQKSISHVAKNMKAMVVYTDAANFSAGANLALAGFAGNIAAWGQIEQLVTGGQQSYKALK
ncbi:hypothetical protein ABI003_14985, partial [Enterococcus faecium]|uniref:hypothetical protein n=1 Tax=Enterococcus faecium TaxID=1352 RepID=UPI003F43F125